MDDIFTPQSPHTNPQEETLTESLSANPQYPQHSLWLQCSADYLDLPLLREDITYVDKFLLDLAPIAAIKLLRQYEAVWIKAADSEPSSVRSENAGRFCANTWIRERKEPGF